MFDTASLMIGRHDQTLNESVPSLRRDAGRWIDQQVSRQPNAAEIHTIDGK